MFPLKAKTDDLRVVWCIRPSEQKNRMIDTYFEGISRLSSLLYSDALHDHLNGFHLSLWIEDGIRFTFFVNDGLDGEDFLEDQFQNLNFERYLPRDDEPPTPERYTQYLTKGKTYIQFRRFLQLITNIGLESINWDQAQSRKLAAEYRLDIGPSGQSAKPHFQGWYNNLSYYNSLTSDLKEELLEGLDFWFTSTMDWAHMFVTMVLPGDIVNLQENSAWFNPRKPIPQWKRDRFYDSITGYPNIVDNK